MPTSLDARIDDALFGPRARTEWRGPLETTVKAALDAPLGSLVVGDALADFVELVVERAFLTDTVKPVATALARFLLAEAQRDGRPLASYLSTETRDAVTAFAVSAKPVPAALLEALLAEKGVRAFVEGFLFDAMQEFYERANPFFADSGLPAMVKKMIPIGSGAVLKALDVLRDEFEKRLEPELKKFLGGFTGRALGSLKVGVGGGSRELAEGLASTVLGFVLNRPVSELASEMQPERMDSAVAMVIAILADLDDDETFRARRREIVKGFLTANASTPVRDVLAHHHVRIAPNFDALADATYPLVSGIVRLAPVRSWFASFAETVRTEA